MFELLKWKCYELSNQFSDLHIVYKGDKKMILSILSAI